MALDLQSLGRNENLTMKDNTFIGMIVGFKLDQHGPGNVHVPDRPTTGNKIIVRPNKYEPGRGHITIFNWELSETVAVNVSGVGLAAGEAYEVRDAQNYFAQPLVKGSYDGKPVVIPMTGLTVAAPLGRPAGYPTPPHTGPEFAAFVIMKAAP